MFLSGVSALDHGQLPLALLRIVIGWPFLYEGWTELALAGWASSSCLRVSAGPFAGFFQWLGYDASAVRTVDLLHSWRLNLTSPNFGR
jgi:thiosulfate dehydrogenase [quinone] large subunit